MKVNAYNRLGEEMSVIIDDADHHIWLAYNWKVDPKLRVFITIYDPSCETQRRGLYLHRLIAGAKRGEMVDHINQDTLDNRRENLRICTASQNMANRKVFRVSASGYKGVRLYRNAYVARISKDNVRLFLGSYADPISAANAYDDAAIELHGEFACLNFPIIYG